MTQTGATLVAPVLERLLHALVEHLPPLPGDHLDARRACRIVLIGHPLLDDAEYRRNRTLVVEDLVQIDPKAIPTVAGFGVVMTGGVSPTRLELMSIWTICWLIYLLRNDPTQPVTDAIQWPVYLI